MRTYLKFSAVFFIAVFAAILRGQTPAADKPFTVEEGAAPWSDRVGTWVLADVPEALKTEEILPRQLCANRSVVFPPGSKSALLGLATKDQKTFQTLFSYAQLTDYRLKVKNPNGKASESYVVFYLSPVPEKIKGGFGAGLILLGLNGPAPAPVATPSAQVFELPADKSQLAIYLLMGQSNMLGRDMSKLAGQTSNPRIGSMNGEGAWTIAVDPLWNGTGTGPGISFANSLLSTMPAGQKIGLVQCAVGGTPLARWMKGGDLYARALVRARQAQAAGTLRGILWHQGESDSDRADTASSYGQRLAGMFRDFRADIGIPDLPIVLGQLGEFLHDNKHPFVSTVKQAIETVPADVSRTALADSHQLTDKGDGLHFDADSQIEFGRRYAAEMRQLQAIP